MLHVIAGSGGDGPFGGPGRDRGFHRGGHHPFLFLLVIAAALAAAVLITWLIARRSAVPAAAGAVGAIPPPSPTASAEAILAERLARSEIGPDDYRSLLAALRGVPAAPPDA